MAHRKDEIHQLERALAEVYRIQPDAHCDGIQLSQRVMRDIRQAPGERGGWSPSVVLDQLVWRTATIAAAVVLVVTVLSAGAFRNLAEEGAGALAEEWEPAPLFGD